MIRALFGIALAITLLGCFASENAQPVMAEQNVVSTQAPALFSGELKPGETIHIPVAAAGKLPDQLPGRKVFADERRE